MAVPHPPPEDKASTLYCLIKTIDKRRLATVALAMIGIAAAASPAASAIWTVLFFSKSPLKDVQSKAPALAMQTCAILGVLPFQIRYVIQGIGLQRRAYSRTSGDAFTPFRCFFT